MAFSDDGSTARAGSYHQFYSPNPGSYSSEGWDREKQPGIEVIPTREETSSKRICGLRRGTFCLMVLLIVLVVAGAVGGGVGATIGANNSNKNDGGGHHSPLPGPKTTTTSVNKPASTPTRSSSSAVPAFSSIFPAPSASAPAGCAATVSGLFHVNEVAAEPDAPPGQGLIKKDSQDNEPITFILQDGIMVVDGQGDFGVVHTDYSLGYDKPPFDDDVLYGRGWSGCTNSSLAFGNSALFYGCVDKGYIYYYAKPLRGGECYSYTWQTILLNGS